MGSGTTASVAPAWRRRNSTAATTESENAATLPVEAQPQRGPSIAASERLPMRGNRKRLPRKIEPAALRVARFRHHGHDQNKRHEAEGNDQKENAAPAERIDKRAAGGRTNDNGNPVAARPDSQRAGAFLCVRIGDG